MSAWLDRVVCFFVTPDEAGVPSFAPPRPCPPVVGLLATGADLAVAAGAAAADLRRQARAATALVCLWRGTSDAPLAAPAPGAPAAARLAAKIARRGAAARACGTLCVLELPADPAEASAAARDAIAAADVPAVVALARRDPALDGLLGEADRLLLALDPAADPALAEVAQHALGSLGRPVEPAQVPQAFAARQLARLGLAAAHQAALRAAAAPAARSASRNAPQRWVS